MLKNKVFDLSNNILDFGYTLDSLKDCPYTFDSIISNVKSSLIVFDSNDLIIDSLIAASSSLLNDNDRVFIGLVNENKITDLKHKNLLGGFFRSTKEKTNAAIIIVDKNTYYAALSKDVIFYLGNGDQYKELFELVNHYIWAKSTAELCKGQFKQVNETRLSVSYPEIVTARRYSLDEYKDINGYALSEKFISNNKPTFVTKTNMFNSFLSGSNLELNVFDDYFYTIKFNDFFVKARSFDNKKIGELYSQGNNSIWYNGSMVNILNSDSVNEYVYLPLDEYKDYNPNFEFYLSYYKKIALSVSINVEVNPIVIDASYKPSPKYDKINQYNLQLKNGIEKIKSLFGDDKKLSKQIETIEKERNIFEKADLFNKFITENQAGVSSLNNQKNNFKPIIVDKNDLIVPNDLIGKLFVKSNKEYLALKDESDLIKGKEWLKENKYSATLVLLDE